MPHVAPKGTFWAAENDRVGFVHIRSPHTVRNLRSRPRVTVSVTDIFQRRALILTGTARVVQPESSPDEFAGLAESFVEARGPFPANARAIVVVDDVKVQRVTSPAYDNGATIEEVERVWRRHYERARPTPSSSR
jgi:hypothetical protein